MVWDDRNGSIDTQNVTQRVEKARRYCLILHLRRPCGLRLTRGAARAGFFPPHGARIGGGWAHGPTSPEVRTRRQQRRNSARIELRGLVVFSRPDAEAPLRVCRAPVGLVRLPPARFADAQLRRCAMGRPHAFRWCGDLVCSTPCASRSQSPRPSEALFNRRPTGVAGLAH
jgi:hypothetical protein